MFPDILHRLAWLQVNGSLFSTFWSRDKIGSKTCPAITIPNQLYFSPYNLM